MEGRRVRAVFDALFQCHGPQHWWPADTPFEVMVGAVLTQSTAWTNVERALLRLKARGGLDPDAILGLQPDELADALRPVGYFNVKARRLTAFCEAFCALGGFEALSAMATAELRHKLLAVKGVGPETADDMLLYAFDRAVFVVDAYTRRVFARLGLIRGDEGYEQIRQAFEQALGPDTTLYKEYHALIVRHGKERCRTKPSCAGCVLSSRCDSRRSPLANAQG